MTKAILGELTNTDYIAQVLANHFIACHEQCTDAPIDAKGCNAFVRQHVDTVESLVADYVAEHF